MNKSLEDLAKDVTSRLGKRSFDVGIAPNFPKDIEAELLEDFEASEDMIDEAKDRLAELQAEMELAQKQMDGALEKIRKIYRTLVIKNEVAWEKTFDLKLGAWARLPNGDFGEVIDTSADTGELQLRIFNRQRIEESEFGDWEVAWAEFADLDFEAIDHDELDEILAICDEKQEKYKALKVKACPESPCRTCGHEYCFEYHYRLSSSMSDWELICCSKTCVCIHCVEARKQTDTADHWQCCRCFGIRPKK